MSNVQSPLQCGITACVSTAGYILLVHERLILRKYFSGSKLHKCTAHHSFQLSFVSVARRCNKNFSRLRKYAYFW